MLKFLLELGPIIVFFATYKYSNIFIATLLMLIVTTICLIISYLIDKKLSMALLISGGILLLLGCLTLLSGDSKFIKMKPTIVYIIFAIALYGGIIKNKLILKEMLSHSVSMSDIHWLILSKRFSGYFIFMAILNEVIWRNYSESFWVNFKVFGAAPLTLVFILTQMPFIFHNSKKNIINKK